MMILKVQNVVRYTIKYRFGKAVYKLNTRLMGTKMENLKEKLAAAMVAERPQKPTPRNIRIREATKKKKDPYVPGMVNLQVVGTGANGSPKSVYLFTDHSRYLFNCGEGTQRLGYEHKIKLARLEQVFVTRNTWSMVGGFPGLALTVQDTGVKELSLHGPPHLHDILHSMKRFVILRSLQVTAIDCTKDKYFEDDAICIKSVPLQSNSTVGNTADITETVIAYICTLKPRRGALILEKCVEHGIRPGPLLGQLKNGIDVTLENGVVVKSEDVTEPAETTLSFIILDVPSEDYLPALEMQASQFHELDLNPERAVALVIHFSPEKVMQTNCYQSFMQNFNSQTQHISLGSEITDFSGCIAAHRIQYQLNQLNTNVFPLLFETQQIANSSDKANKLKKPKMIDDETLNNKHDILANEQQNDIQLARVDCMARFHLRPKTGMDLSLQAQLNPSEYINETQELEEFPTILEKLKLDLKSTTEYGNEYPKILFLGTGSCIPNKTRNVSAILVQPHKSAYILLDCGEGTFGQIIRFFGNERTGEVLRNLRAIYISHLHADHHIGLISLLNERQRLLKSKTISERLLIFAPKQIKFWLDFYDKKIESIRNAYEIIGNGSLLREPYVISHKNMEDTKIAISTCLVRHCPHSFGVSLSVEGSEAEKPIKITYSGDTMPCEDLVELGYKSTILIHEATMEDDLVEEAKMKTHSTISQAICQGRLMQAQHIILTHFSQRYAKLPRIQNMDMITESETMRNVTIAFDNMQVNLPELEKFHLMYPALKALFAEHAKELDQKALKRELKLDRKRKLLINN